MSDHVSFMREAVQLAQDNRAKGAQPFGAVLTRDGQRIATGVNEIVQTCDPTSHAEMQAVRAASAALKQPRLDGCVVYASGYPCPMCLTAMYLAGVGTVYYAYSNEDGEPYDLSAERGYLEIARPPEQREMPLHALRVRDDGEDLYEAWKKVAPAA